MQQFRVQRIGIFELEGERERDIARQQAHTGRSIRCAGCRAPAEGDLARGLELVAEALPGFTELCIVGAYQRILRHGQSSLGTSK